MPREQVLYEIFKLPSEFICARNLNIENYTVKQGLADNNIVSIGDNIAFQQLRFLKGDNRNPSEIFKEVQFLRQNIRKSKKEGNALNAKLFSQRLMRIVFVPEYVTVSVSSKSQYRKLARRGFILNGKRYLRFNASAGSIRHNCVNFMSEDYHKELTQRLMCGLLDRIKTTNIAKLSAYFSLATSSIMWVSKPRVCIIDDFDTTLKNQKIDWIVNYTDEQGREKKKTEERTLDITMNSCDGQGLLSPEMAAKWSQEMGLDYIASSYVVRSVFMKGNLVPFDFKAYAKENGVSVIYDKWKHPHNIEDVDALISVSQFKEWKAYSSYEDYDQYAEKYNIGWGVSRYNRKYDSEWVLANYQCIQVLDIDKDDIIELITPTIDWIQKICSGDSLYSYLYSFGGFSENMDIEYNDVYTRAQSLATQAVIKNPEFLNDAFVQRKIYKNIVEAINKSKIGKIWVRGNYSFMISDPIAQCRSALGLKPDGEIPGEYIYSNFWNERKNPGDEIVLCRSPLLDKHEVNHCTLYRSEEADKWYSWIKSGIIYSIYDLSTLRHSDSDFDGDIALSSDNPILLKGSQKNTTNPISYDKDPAPSQLINIKNFIETDIRGFGTKVGTYSNYSTIFEAMRAGFDDDSPEDQELLLRKKLLREINGQEIDRIKGVEAKGPPKDEWLIRWNYSPNDTEEKKKEIYFHNSLVVSKKPYFFRYLYSELNQKFKQFESTYNTLALAKFKMKLKKLLIKENKTDEERKFARDYFNFCPLIMTNCTMNILCKRIESIDFDIKYNKNCQSMLPYLDLNSFKFDPEIMKRFRIMYQKYSNKKSLSIANEEFETEDEGFKEELRFGIIDAVKEELQEEYATLGLTTMEGLTYIKALSQSYASFNWGFAWDILGDLILDCIEEKNTVAPVECEDGEEYLGRKYKLVEIQNPKAV